MNAITLLMTVLAMQGGQAAQQTAQPVAPTLRIYDDATSNSNPKIDLILDGASVAQAVSADVISGPFTPKDPRNAVLEVRKSGTTADLLDQKIDLAGHDHVLVIMGDPDTSLNLGDLSIDPVKPADQQAHVNFYNAASSQLDLYVVGPSDTADNATPSASAVGAQGTSSTAVNAGTYKVLLTAAGSKDAPVQSSSFDAKAGDRYAVLAVSSAGQPPRVVMIPLQ